MNKLSQSKFLQKIPLLLIVLIAIALLIYTIWRLQTSPETDNAFVYADTINVVPEVSGKIEKFYVSDNQFVKKGDLLFQIDARPYEENLAAATARLNVLNKQIDLHSRTIQAQKYNASAVKASIERAKAVAQQTRDTRIRLEPLYKEGFASKEEVDQAKTAELSATADLNSISLQAQQAQSAVTGDDALIAQREEVRAEIALAKLNIEYTQVRAPFDGRVSSLKTSIGQYATALKPLFTLINTEKWFVIANFRETDLKNITAGTPVKVRIMSDTSKTFDAVVDSIGYGVLPDDGGSVFEGLPMVKRTINWVHVSQRFPVKVYVKNPDINLFRIGASATVQLSPQDKK